jgi:antitoxin component YwqK of YwqJK toxin-antitoxin module
MSALKNKSLVIYCAIFCMQYFFSQTKVYDVKETTLHLEDSIVYLRSTMTPISGIIQEIDTNKKKVFEASFISGKKSGAVKMWSSDGKLIFSGNYLKGLPHGSFEGYYTSGKIKAKCNYIEGKLNGKCQGWYEDHGQLKYEENYRLGGLFGVQRYFSQNGVSLGGGDLVNGNGKLVLYHPNKTIAIENSYLNGLLAFSKEYSLQGKIQSAVEYRNGKLNGKCLFWDDTDHEIAEQNYLNGKKNGASMEYFRDGKIKLEEYYMNGVLDSARRVWSDKGKLLEESFWDNGSNVNTKYWNENGELLSNTMPTGGFTFTPGDVSDGYQRNSTHSDYFNTIFKDNFDVLVSMIYPSHLWSCVGSNPNNPSNSPYKANNPFGDGGIGGGRGGGNGTFDGNGKGTGGEGDGEGGAIGRRDSKPIKPPVFPKYNTDVDLYVHLKLTVDGEGNVVKAKCINSKTTTDNQTIIDDVIQQVIRQVKYNKDPEGKSSYCFLTVKINAK